MVIRRNNTQIAQFYSDRLSIGVGVGNAQYSNYIGVNAGYTVTVRCECGVTSVVPWADFTHWAWSDIQSCECCGSSATVRTDVRCSGCGETFEVLVHGS